jgi:hypothetical protein
MKPDNWDTMSGDERREMAYGLLATPRGPFLVSQALFYAIKAMSAVPDRDRETSNIQDMEMLLEIVFPIYKAVANIQDREPPEAVPV